MAEPDVPTIASLDWPSLDPPDGQPGGEPSAPGTLEDVPLWLDVELGSATLTLAEAAHLGAGSVIVLDQAAGDPVVLRLNDVPIAEGELVALGDQFAVRITRVLEGPA